MATLYNYDFNQTTLVVNGREITGFGQGDGVITIARRSDSASDVMGANGDMMVAMNTDRSGTITFTLLQGSESNLYMSGLLGVQENGVYVPVTVQFADSLTGDIGSGSQGYILRAPDMTRGVGVNEATWTINVVQADILHNGGNVN